MPERSSSVFNKASRYVQFLDDRRLISKSGLFDAGWYLRTYPDVARSKVNPAAHYLLYGGSEGRNPGPNFSSQWYLDTYADVKASGINPLLHYLKFGQKEGRQLNVHEAVSLERVLDSGALSERLLSVEERLKDVEVFLAQMQTIVARETDIPLPPPKHLQVRVVGGYVPDFVESGFRGVYPDLNRILEPANKELKDFKTLLDFGCGCGRAVRALATLLPESEIHGTDIDPEAIAWLQENYTKFGQFSVAPPLPPTVYADNQFDFIFGISVLTHLPEDMQFAWLKELERITRPGGYVILTTHGEKFWKQMGPEVARIMERDGFHYCEPGFNYGKSISLPDFYQNAYHTHDYIRREWSRYFDVVDLQVRGMDDHQDTVLLYKRPN